jgi:lauroyl/myristoyl acyltransferase
MAALVIAVLAQADKSPALSELIDRVRRRGFMEFSPAVYKGLKSIAQTMVQG